MLEYRLYFLRDDGHIRDARILTAESDDEALEKARAHPERPARSELWSMDRRIAVLESDKCTTSP